MHSNEYSFPIVDAVEPTSSPSDSNPSGSLPRSPPSHSHSHSRSLHRSSTNTGSSSRHRRSDRDRHGDRDRHRDRDRDKDPSARVLSRIASREFRDIKNTRTLLVLITERLENETRRADRAEQHALSLVQKLREANESTLFARSEVSSLNSSLGLYKLQLEHAQREIERAQGIVNQLEKERIEAESEAARARTTARKLREERLLELAREEGRKEGYREGYSRGKNMGYFEAKTSERRGVNGRASLASMSANSNTNTGTVSDERRREGGRDSWSTRRDSESQNQTYGVAPPPVLRYVNCDQILSSKGACILMLFFSVLCYHIPTARGAQIKFQSSHLHLCFKNQSLYRNRSPSLQIQNQHFLIHTLLLLFLTFALDVLTPPVLYPFPTQHLFSSTTQNPFLSLTPKFESKIAIDLLQ